MTTQIHECRPHDTKEQLYDVRLHDVELHDVANTCFANVKGSGGGLGDSGNARKETFFFILGLP